MSNAHTGVISAALSLPPSLRAELAEELLNSFEDPRQLAADAAWAKEAERRIDQRDRGTTNLLPVDEFISRL